MALTGNLEDMSILDLIQFPHMRRKTGELIVTGAEDDALIFYRDGSIVHAILGESEGFEVLVNILDWNEGEFEFQSKQVPVKDTIEGDLHQNVMRALKERDEREEAKRLARERARMSRHHSNKPSSKHGEQMIQNSEDLQSLLANFVRDNAFALHVCVLSAEGPVLAEAGNQVVHSSDLLAYLHGLVQEYPREGLQRVIFCDDDFTVLLNTLRNNDLLLLFANSEAPLGAVFRGIGNLGQQITGGRR
jgi:hypothetical protein